MNLVLAAINYLRLKYEEPVFGNATDLDVFKTTTIILMQQLACSRTY